MLSGAAARRININTDGRSLPTKKRWPTSSKLCAPLLLSASCAPRFNLPVTSTTAFVLTHFFAQTPPFCVSLSSFSLSPI